MAIGLRFSAIQMWLPILINVERCASILSHVGILVEVHAGNVKRGKLARSPAPIMEFANRSVAGSTRLAATTASNRVMAKPNAHYAQRPAKFAVAIPNATRNAMSLVRLVQSRPARQAAPTHNVPCRALRPVTRSLAQRGVNKSWAVGIDVHLYAERYVLI